MGFYDNNAVYLNTGSYILARAEAAGDIRATAQRCRTKENKRRGEVSVHAFRKEARGRLAALLRRARRLARQDAERALREEIASQITDHCYGCTVSDCCGLPRRGS